MVVMAQQENKFLEGVGSLAAFVGLFSYKLYFLFIFYNNILVNDFMFPVIGIWKIFILNTIFVLLTFNLRVESKKLEVMEETLGAFMLTTVLFAFYWLYQI